MLTTYKPVVLQHDVLHLYKDIKNLIGNAEKKILSPTDTWHICEMCYGDVEDTIKISQRVQSRGNFSYNTVGVHFTEKFIEKLLLMSCS